jgi:hypothetical protein
MWGEVLVDVVSHGAIIELFKMRLRRFAADEVITANFRQWWNIPKIRQKALGLGG